MGEKRSERVKKLPNLWASRVALFFVLIVVGSIFFWWVRNRPSYLLYQATSEMNEGKQSAVISEYQRLLRKKDLPPAEEIRMRKALGTFFVRAFQETNGVSMYMNDSDSVENPYLELAKREFDRVIVLDGKDAEAHYYLGRILWVRRLEAFAMEELNLSRQYDPKNPEPLWFLARAYLERGNASLARETALQALAIRPDYDEARQVLSDAYAALGDYRRAIEQFDRLSPGFRSDPDTLASHALLLARQKEWRAADHAISEAERIGPNNGRVKLLAGRVLLEKNELEEASGKFAQAAALMPKNVWPLVWQSIGFSRRNLCDEAARPAHYLAERLPRWAWSHLAMAECFKCQGETAHALSSLDEALRLSPELKEAIDLKVQILETRMGLK